MMASANVYLFLIIQFVSISIFCTAQSTDASDKSEGDSSTDADTVTDADVFEDGDKEEKKKDPFRLLDADLKEKLDAKKGLIAIVLLMAAFKSVAPEDRTSFQQFQPSSSLASGMSFDFR